MNWSQTERDELLKCGIPLNVYEEAKSWQYFIDHGSHPLCIDGPGVSVNSLERHFQERLCNFLEAREEFASSVAANRLRHLLDRDFW